MTNYTIAESYTLPSGGKIYGTDVVPDIKIRSMTTAEEMKRLAPSDYLYKNMCEIIDDCLVEKPGISSYDMCVGDYTFLLHKLRIVTYGPDYVMESVCPYCGCKTKKVIKLDELKVKEYEEGIEALKEFDLPVSKKHIKLNLQTPRLLDNIATRVKDFKKKTDGKELDPTIIFTVEALIAEIDGSRPDPVHTTDWVRNLPMADTNAILNHANKLNDSIGIITTVSVPCDICGLKYNTAFRPTVEFFRPALNI